MKPVTSDTNLESTSLDTSNSELTITSLESTSLKQESPEPIPLGATPCVFTNRNFVELQMRCKAKLLVQRKIKQKFKDIDFCDEELAKLESELLEELEDTIVKKIEARSKGPINSENEEATAEDTYEMKGFYWGGEDCCEMIFFDDK